MCNLKKILELLRRRMVIALLELRCLCPRTDENSASRVFVLFLFVYKSFPLSTRRHPRCLVRFDGLKRAVGGKSSRFSAMVIGWQVAVEKSRSSQGQCKILGSCLMAYDTSSKSEKGGEKNDKNKRSILDYCDWILENSINIFYFGRGAVLL